MRTNLLMVTLLLFLAGVAHAFSQPMPQDMKLVGEARLKILWLDIYQARLENPEGRFSSIDSPQMLTLIYQRDISKKKLIDETAKQWRQAGLNPEQYQSWLAELDQIWPDIRKQDRLAFYQDGSGQGHFYFNQQYLGALSDPEFSRSFLAIWLADDTDFPEFTRTLKGQ